MSRLLAVLLTAFTASAYAGVAGVVSDSASGFPVNQAWVKFGSADSTQTNAAGQYTLPNLGAGTYQVVIRRSGYWNHRQQVTLVAGDNTVHFQLVPLGFSVNPVGWWNFENSAQPLQADVGRDLVLQGTHQVIQGPGGTGAVNIGVGSFYRCYHDIAANGGGSNWVNEFSIVMDFRVPQLGRWYTFYQTNITNSNDGDAFINTNGNIGVALTGYSSYAVVPNEWYRLIISADLGSSYKYYLDGQLLQDGGAQSLNGRFALYPANNGNQVLFFADENGEDNPIDVAQVVLYDVPLSAGQAASLGGYGHIITDPANVMTPYLQSPTATSMFISWHYQPSQNTVVEYGTSESLGQTVVGSAQVLSPAVIWHTAQLTGLQPGTTYFYRCRSDTASTSIARFRTPPAPGTRTGKLRFLWISDSQTNISKSTEIAGAIRQTLISRFGTDFADSVSLLMHSGDIVGNGLNLATYQTEYFLPFRQLNQCIPFMVSIGNHEVESGYYYSYMKYEPFAGPEGERYYSFVLGRVLFIALNSNTQGATQANWLNTRLQQAQSDTTLDMVFVATHHPGHSEVWPDGNTSWVQNTVLPMLDSYPKAVLITFGHSHNYERGARPAGNLRTLLCGGAGGTLDRWRMYGNQTDYPEIHRSFDYYNYVLFEVDLANQSYEATAYTLGNENRPLANIPFDYWRQALNQAPPLTPQGIVPTRDWEGPVTLIANGFLGADTIQSSQFQVTASPGNYTSPLLDASRDFENYYFDTGSPLYMPLDRNAGIALTQYAGVQSLLQAGHEYGWRVRYRDRNLKWSNWSEERRFTWLGDDGLPPLAPRQLTATSVSDNVRLRWERPAGGASRYHVFRDTSPTGSFDLLLGTTTDTTFVDSGAVSLPNVRNYYLVKSELP